MGAYKERNRGRQCESYRLQEGKERITKWRWEGKVRSQMCVQWNEEAGRNAEFGIMKSEDLSSVPSSAPCLHNL